LDFRDQVACEKYASFRQEASFDKQLWSLAYVQTEVIATILRAIEVSKASSTFIEIDLFLSKRLSTFRIEGTSDAIIVTREDPTDNAALYRRSDPHFGAFLKEFSWIKQEAGPYIGWSSAAGIPGHVSRLFRRTNPSGSTSSNCQRLSLCPVIWGRS
jgi:hypothetical protein